MVYHHTMDMILSVISYKQLLVTNVNPAKTDEPITIPSGTRTQVDPKNHARGLLPISLLGEQRHDGCEQSA